MALQLIDIQDSWRGNRAPESAALIGVSNQTSPLSSSAGTWKYCDPVALNEVLSERKMLSSYEVLFGLSDFCQLTMEGRLKLHSDLHIILTRHSMSGYVHGATKHTKVEKPLISRCQRELRLGAPSDD